MRALHYSVVIQRELSKTVTLSIFRTVFVSVLTYGHESWAMTERMQSQVQAFEMRFLHCLTNCVALRFKNVLTSSRYFCELKDLSLDDLAV